MATVPASCSKGVLGFECVYYRSDSRWGVGRGTPPQVIPGMMSGGGAVFCFVLSLFCLAFGMGTRRRSGICPDTTLFD